MKSITVTDNTFNEIKVFSYLFIRVCVDKISDCAKAVCFFILFFAEQTTDFTKSFVAQCYKTIILHSTIA